MNLNLLPQNGSCYQESFLLLTLLPRPVATGGGGGGFAGIAPSVMRDAPLVMGDTACGSDPLVSAVAPQGIRILAPDLLLSQRLLPELASFASENKSSGTRRCSKFHPSLFLREDTAVLIRNA